MNGASGIGGARTALIAVFSVLLAAALALAQDWAQKPPADWNAKDITSVLTDSPWVAQCAYRQYRVGSTRWFSYYRIRVLTALPVRQAYLRYLTLAPDPRQILVDYRNLRGKNTSSAARSLFDRFVAANPDDIRLTGSDEYIVVSITEAYYERNISRPTGWHETSRPEAFIDLKLSDIQREAFLATDDGRKIPVMRFDPPSFDGLGAKLWFPRHLSPGKAWVKSTDKKLRFQLRLGGKTLKAIFDLPKMLYDGKLEI